MSKISVIIPSYNHEKYVSQAIQSVLNQTFQDFEIIITDDGSSDKTVSQIKKFKDPRITVFCFKKNLGAPLATKKSLSVAKGKYISFLNSDDMFMPNKLEKQIAFLESHPNIGAVFSEARIIDEDGNYFTDPHHFYYDIFYQQNRNRYQWLNYFFYKSNCLCYPSVMIPRKVLDKIGEFNNCFAQLVDFDYWVRLTMKFDIHIIQENLVKFRVRNEQKNISAEKPELFIRQAWEFTQILKHFLSIDNIDFFLEIFPEARKIIKKPEKYLIPFYIAQLALKINSPAYQSFAREILYNLLQSKKTSLELESEYGFKPIDLVILTGKTDDSNTHTIKSLLYENNRLKKKNAEYEYDISRLKAILDEIQSAKFFKLWQSYCKLRDSIIKK